MNQKRIARHSSDQMYRLLVQGVTDYAIYMLTPEGLVANWNTGARRAKGYTAKEIVGRHFSRFYPEADRVSGMPQLALETARTTGRFEGEGWRVRKDGTRFWAHVIIDRILHEGALIGFAKITRDLTDQRALQRQATEHLRRFELLVKGVTDYAIYMLTPEGLVANWNAGAERAKGYTAEEIVGHHFSRFYEGKDRDAGMPQRALETARRDGRFEGRGWRLRKDGKRFWAHVVIDPIHDEEGVMIGYAKITRDMTEQKAQEDRVEHMAHHDLLTDLPNRLVLQERLHTLLGGCASPCNGGSTDVKPWCAVLYLDLDRFKPVNDTLGHSAGDDVLRAVAGRLRATVRVGDTVSRVGGDEFVVLQSGCSSPNDAMNLATRIVSVLQQPFQVHGKQVQIGASIGIALAPTSATDAEGLLRNADLALYRAKIEGRNRACSYDPSMEEEHLKRNELEHCLRGALRNGEFSMHYQPVVELKTGKLTSLEALLRWKSPTQGDVPPIHFIPFAEEIGLMNEIGDWALRTACEAATHWSEPLTVAVNLSVVQLKRPELFDLVVQILRETGLPPHRLELEVTETAMLHDIAAASALLERLRGIGVRIALDDFGTGYSSLSFLRSLPFTRIKIDRSFVKDYGVTAEATAIVRAIGAMCNSLQVAVTVEGVETEAQMRMLRRQPPMEAQGFWISRPQPALEIPALIARLGQKDSAPLLPSTSRLPGVSRLPSVLGQTEPVPACPLAN